MKTYDVEWEKYQHVVVERHDNSGRYKSLDEAEKFRKKYEALDQKEEYRINYCRHPKKYHEHYCGGTKCKNCKKDITDWLMKRAKSKALKEIYKEHENDSQPI